MAQFFYSLQKRVMPFDQSEGRFGISREVASFIRSSFWAITGQIISSAGMVLGVRIITEYVSPSEFGTVSLCMGIVVLGSGVFNGPVYQALLRMYPDMQRQSRLPLLMTEIRQLLIESTGLLMAVSMVAVLIILFFTEVNFVVLLILAGLVVVEALRGLVATILSAKNEIKRYAFVVTGDVLARQGFAVLLVLILGASVTSIIGGYLVGAALLSLWYVRVLRGINIRSDGCNQVGQGKHVRQEIVEFSRPLMPIALAGSVSGLGDRYVIGGILGVEAAGIYAAVYGLVSKPFLMISTALELALRQSYYHAVSTNDEPGQAKVMSMWLWSALAASVICLGIVTFWADELTWLLLGEKFQSGANLIPWIALGYCLFALSSPLERRAYAHKQTGSVLRIQAGGAIASVLAGMVGTYSYGILGAAWAVPVYFGCQLALAVYLTHKISRFAPCSEKESASE
ncbi:MAG: oligosaccharide flippase family protein [Nitrospira sp.]|nr:oligosaccharide flippase family protein [Nitrospira sp.]